MNTIKVTVKGLEVKLDARAYVKWENRAIAAKKTVPEMLSLFLAGKVQRT